MKSVYKCTEVSNARCNNIQHRTHDETVQKSRKVNEPITFTSLCSILIQENKKRKTLEVKLQWNKFQQFSKRK